MYETTESEDPVVICGIGCRFGGGISSRQDYWEKLIKGVDCVTEIKGSRSDGRFDTKAFYHPSRDNNKPGKMYNCKGGYVEDFKTFDHRFWGLSKVESLALDPQIRKLLEVTYHCIEDSGTPPAQIKGTNTGVFVGITSSEYACVVGDPEVTNAYSNSGVNSCMAANRISYQFDLKGPSFPIDTASILPGTINPERSSTMGFPLASR